MKFEKAIISILKEQINTYKILLGLLNKEREYLVDIDAEKVEEISKEKDTVVMKLRLLEEERIRLMNNITSAYGMKNNCNLEELAEYTGDSVFRTLRSQMLSLLQNIEEMNKFNSILINRSIKHIRISNNFFNSFATEHIPHATGVLMSKET